MESDIELSINEQKSLISMLRSQDRESMYLAFSIIDSHPRPSIMINLVSLNIEPRTGNSFMHYVRYYAFKELNYIYHDDNDKLFINNRLMLERLCHY